MKVTPKPVKIIREKLAKEAVQDKAEAKKKTSLKDFLEWLGKLAKLSRTVNKLIANEIIFSDLKDKHILLDTCCLIHATKQPELVGKFLNDLNADGCDLLAIPTVKLEFLRGADSFSSLRAREKYLVYQKVDLYPIEAYLNRIPEYSVVMQKVSGNKSIELSDYLLIASLVIHPEMYILTENHHHMPMGILDRTHIVTWDNDKDIKNLAFYKLNKEKYQSTVSEILKRPKTSPNATPKQS